MTRSVAKFFFSHQYLIGLFCGFLLATTLLQFPGLECLDGQCFQETEFLVKSRIKRKSEESQVKDSSDPAATVSPVTPAPSRRKDRILCWVVTTPFTKSKAKMVKNTWGSRCDKLLFMSSQNDSSLPAIGLPLNGPESRLQLWNKAKLTFRYIYTHHLGDYDWFFKADEDTYTIMENMRHFLSSQDPSQPLILGRRFKGFVSGGSGYVLSRETIRRLVEIGLDGDVCKTDLTGNVDDVIIAICLRKLNVTFGDTRDEFGHQTFIPYTIEEFYRDEGPSIKFIRQSDYYPYNKGYNCCSSRAISFHYVSGYKMQMFEYLLYRLKVHNDKVL